MLPLSALGSWPSLALGSLLDGLSWLFARPFPFRHLELSQESLPERDQGPPNLKQPPHTLTYLKALLAFSVGFLNHSSSHLFILDWKSLVYHLPAPPSEGSEISPSLCPGHAPPPRRPRCQRSFSRPPIAQAGLGVRLSSPLKPQDESAPGPGSTDPCCT